MSRLDASSEAFCNEFKAETGLSADPAFPVATNSDLKFDDGAEARSGAFNPPGTLAIVDEASAAIAGPAQSTGSIATKLSEAKRFSAEGNRFFTVSRL